MRSYQYEQYNPRDGRDRYLAYDEEGYYVRGSKKGDSDVEDDNDEPEKAKKPVPINWMTIALYVLGALVLIYIINKFMG